MFGRSKHGATPLPVAQITVLMAVRLAEPIAYNVIFPFVNQMVEELGVTDNPDRVGFYSGLVESVFAFVQFFTVYHWAKMSDKIGRKPVLLLGLTGVAISGSLFGLAKSFWAMIVFRSLSGALNGNVAVIKAAIGDITDDSNSTEAFAMYGLTWIVGTMIGNAMGGTLSHPYERLPNWFGSFTLLQEYPYLLRKSLTPCPCLVAAGLTVIGILFSLLFYHESLPGLATPHRPALFPLHIDTGLSRLSSSLPSPFSPFSRSPASHKRQASMASLVSESETLVDSEGTQDLLGKSKDGNGGEWTFPELMRFKKVRVMVGTQFLNSFMQGAWGAAVLLFFFDRHNGLGMSASAIGLSLALNGLWTILCQILLLSRIRRWFGISMGYKVLSAGWPLIWLILPLLRNVLTATETPLPPPEDDQYTHPLLYPETRGWPTAICVNLYLSLSSVVAISSSLLMAVVNYSSPDRTALGAINGISTAAGCMARVIGPSSVSALFAISMDGQVMNGRLWWIVMVGMSLINLGVCCLLENDPSGSAYLPKDIEEGLDVEMGGMSPSAGPGDTSERVG
ncbi:hypothetical protein I350_01374 [Cryptococcus amylolentus CBS 6273]|uniref:Major facilitator superfamily (MFS) profile domain-containing protein n=1 Tax=Cryptococcus amylolentus CBS 6273 TaxID=1296118 RepID=A0A1E3KCT1_9TREE|nr:hypothetical protein I350_01374 [Cryptococcus amylolentus CBS 6273]